MKQFSYQPILTDITDRGLSNHDIFKKHFKDDWQWLEDHAIQYQVDVFRWPQMPFFTQYQIAKIRSEITLTIEDVNHYVMFRLYSGLNGE